MEAQRPALDDNQFVKKVNKMITLTTNSQVTAENKTRLVPGWYPGYLAEQKLGISRSTLYRYRKDGKIEADKDHGRWVYKLDEKVRQMCLK